MGIASAFLLLTIFSIDDIYQFFSTIGLLLSKIY